MSDRRFRGRTTHAAAFLAASVLSLAPAQAADVIQLATATLKGEPLFTSTGQVIDQRTCDKIVAQNLADAPAFGFTTADGAFLDPKTGISIRQSCAAAWPAFEKAPMHPISMAPDATHQPPPQVPCPPPARRLVIFTFGQSNAANFGEARYSASPHVFVYSNGRCLPAHDPLPGAEGDEGSPWGRLGDRLVKAGRYDNVVIIAASVGGTSIGDWAPDGSLGARLTGRIRNALGGAMRPDVYLLVQGEADSTMTEPPEAASLADLRTFRHVPTMSRQKWRDTFAAVLESIRALDVSEPVYVANVSRCNMRVATLHEGLDFDKVIWRNPSYYVTKEVARIEVRAGQRLPVGTQGVRAGPDLDPVPPEMRFDGCHFSRRGLDESADRWFEALTRQ